MLTYDTPQGGYVVDLNKDVLENAPHYRSGEEPSFDRDYDREVVTTTELKIAGRSEAVSPSQFAAAGDS